MNQLVAGIITAVVVTIIGATIALVTSIIKDRANPAKQIAEASAATTASILSTMLPLTDRVARVEAEVRVLYSYTGLLRNQIRSLGAEPVPWPSWPDDHPFQERHTPQ